MAYKEPAIATSKEKQRPKVLHSIEVKHAENGGHILTHRFDNSGPGYGYHESEDHAYGAEEGDKVLGHIAKHMGLKNISEKTEEKDEEKIAPGIHKKVAKMEQQKEASGAKR